MEILDQINQTLTELIGPFGPLAVVGGLGLVMVLITLPVLLKKQEDPLDKLHKATRSDANKRSEKKLRTAGGKDKLEKYADFLEPKDKEEYSAARLHYSTITVRSNGHILYISFNTFFTRFNGDHIRKYLDFYFFILFAFLIQ